MQEPNSSLGRRRRRLGRIIKKTRVKYRRTQQEIADALGVSVRQVQRYEAGERTISTARLELIAEFFGIDPSELIDIRRPK